MSLVDEGDSTIVATEVCVRELRSMFKFTFFDKGILPLKTFYGNLQSDFDSVTTYISTSHPYRSEENGYCTFLKGCKHPASEWFFPAIDKETYEETSLIEELIAARKFRRSKLNIQFVGSENIVFDELQNYQCIGIRERITNSFEWLFSDNLSSLKTQVPLNSGECKIPTCVNLSDAMEYLRLYEVEDYCPFHEIKGRLEILNIQFQEVLDDSGTDILTLESIRRLSQDLQICDKFLSADEQRFKHIHRFAIEKLSTSHVIIQNAIENHDFHKVGELIKLYSGQDRQNFEGLLKTELEMIINNIHFGQLIFEAIHKIHCAFLYCSSAVKVNLLQAKFDSKLKLAADELMTNVDFIKQSIKKVV